MNEIDDETSCSARCALFGLPGGLSDFQVTPLKGSVQLIDFGPVLLFTEFGLTDPEIAYTATTFLTPFPFMPGGLSTTLTRRVSNSNSE